MFHSFLLVFPFGDNSDHGTLGQAQRLQFEQTFGAGAFAVGAHGDIGNEAFGFLDKLSGRAGVQTIRCGNRNFLLEQYVSPTY